MKNEETKKRKSNYNPNRTCYLTADGKYYCYERWDYDAKCVVTQKLEVGKDLSLELTLCLDQSDHDMDLNDRYQYELRDPLFDAKFKSYKSDPDGEDAITLTAASTMVFYSLDYSMSNFEQAKARIHRAGQKENCHYIYLVCKNTVDRKVLYALRKKINLAKMLVDDYRKGRNPFKI